MRAIFKLALIAQVAAALAKAPINSLPSCSKGTYRSAVSGAKDVDNCPGFAECEPGFYCENEVRIACPAGRYGGTSALTSNQCSGQCTAGFFCAQFTDPVTLVVHGSSRPDQHECGAASKFCPQGSSQPSAVPTGFYSIGGTSNTTRTAVSRCPIGHYCSDGKLFQCPAGRYGTAEGLSSPACSGICAAGYYCPAGSTSPTQFECGGTDVYCPEGASAPLPVSPGIEYEAAGGSGGGFSVAKRGTRLDESRSSAFTRTESETCPLGHYCVGGVRYRCPAGRYGNTYGQTLPSCTGNCSAGYYCPEASTSPQQLACGASHLYCPPLSGQPVPVSTGYYTVGPTKETRFQQLRCEPGYWCQDGNRFKCNPGRYGASFGLHHADCDGPCADGHYCPLGSTSATEVSCGDQNVYCPEGSRVPLDARTGYYTVRVIPEARVQLASAGINRPGSDAVQGSIIEGSDPRKPLTPPRDLAAGSASASQQQITGYDHPDSLTQFHPPDSRVFPVDSQLVSLPDRLYSIVTDISIATNATRNEERRCEMGHYCIGGIRYPCRAGRYGDVRGEDNPDCSGPCSPGYYCPTTASTRPTQLSCGSAAVYCPEESVQPIYAQPGYFTVGGNSTTRYAEEICPLGHYCHDGIRIPCPPGSYGGVLGLNTSECSGPCEPGYYCPVGSISARQLACGSHDVYCPEGSRAPVPVLTGYYTVGGRNDRISASSRMECRLNSVHLPEDLYGPLDMPFNSSRRCVSGLIGDEDTRSSQVQCEPGMYCVAGLRYECHPGRYGSAAGLSDPLCTGECRPGYFCPWASTKADQEECGDPSRYCPARSGAPTPVDIGYYTPTERRSTIRSYQTPCEPGYYCIQGIRIQCPAGTYGETYGLATPACSGLCDAGFYCPINSVNRQQLECGGSHLYCPLGSPVPINVTVGWYTIGGWENTVGLPQNTTRSDQRECEPRHYCEGGIKRQCPAGTYGATSGLSSSACTGPCDAGHFCPPGSIAATEYKCGDIFVPGRNADHGFDTHMDEGAVIGGGSAGAGITGARNPPIPSNLRIPWYSGDRIKRPALEVHLDSVAAIHTLSVHGGVTSVYCPVGSRFPKQVDPGFYTVGGTPDNTTRADQVRCEKGYFCITGMKMPCPEGTFGDRTGLRTRYCAGVCPAGYACPMATEAPVECPPNHYSTAGMEKCIQCPSALPAYGRCKDSRRCCTF